MPDRIEHPATEPPAVLFHGTSAAVVETILRDGLRPMARQYVHLSADVATARQVGSRRPGPVVVLVVDAARAHAGGVAFYDAGRGVWIADAVPAAYLRADPPGYGRAMTDRDSLRALQAPLKEVTAPTPRARW